MPAFKSYAKKAILFCSLFISMHAIASVELPDGKNFPALLSGNEGMPIVRKVADSIYNLVGLADFGLDREVFFTAYKGMQFLQRKGMLRKTNLLTICDYSQSCNNKRLYVVDLLNSRLLFNTLVSHGKNSGEEFATSFSNEENSNKSSLGFMVTEGTYNGKAGLSMRFKGVEKGINDHVTDRSIVLHGSKFVNETVMNARGIIGRSLGCPAVPYGIHKRIIDVIKGGSCFFINNSDDFYVHTSKILNAPGENPSLEINSSLTAQPIAERQAAGTGAATL